MPSQLFAPSSEGEARLLLLISAFTGRSKSLEGRTKLAKLDFFLRYPDYLRRAINIRAPATNLPDAPLLAKTIENRMIRYRYGPWDPAYFSLLGRLLGRGLVDVVPGAQGLHFRTSGAGSRLAAKLAETEDWKQTAAISKLLRRHLDLSGASLKRFVYKNFPEVTAASWGEPL